MAWWYIGIVRLGVKDRRFSLSLGQYTNSERLLHTLHPIEHDSHRAQMIITAASALVLMALKESQL